MEKLVFPDGTEITAEVIRSGNLMEIRNPSGSIPLDKSVIKLVSDDGEEYGVFGNYNTVYLQTENSIILSNDGSVYVEPEPVPPYTPTLAELIAAKKSELNVACNDAIVSGFDVTISTGAEHFDLKLEDQMALFLCGQRAAAGENKIEWHPNGESTLPCRYYSAADMTIITTAAVQHRSYHQTYCNALKVWAEACETEEDLEEIFYGADVPVEYQSEVLKDYLAAMQEEVDAVTM